MSEFEKDNIEPDSKKEELQWEDPNDFVTPDEDSDNKVDEEIIALEAEKGGNSISREIYEWAGAIIIAVVIALMLRTFVFTFVNVKGSSMEPTLQNGNGLFVSRLGYVPKYGDIVIFRPKNAPNTPYIKRVIGMPGQKVDLDITTGNVYIDGVALQEDYIKEKFRVLGDTQFPLVVPEDKVFVMGDNRNNSKDSRYSDVGLISYDTIIGTAEFRVWPINEMGKLHFKD